MRNRSIREFRQDLSRLEKLLAKEGEVVITRRGEPVARVLPFQPAGAHRGFRSLKWLRDKMPLQKVGSEVSIREDRDARG